MIKTYSGTAKEYGNGWWAFCAQLPIAAHGETYNEALQGMIESIESYLETLEGARAPKMRRMPDPNSGLPFRLTIEIGQGSK